MRAALVSWIVPLWFSVAAAGELKDPPLAPRFAGAELRGWVTATEVNGTFHGADGEWNFQFGDHAEITYAVKTEPKPIAEIVKHYETTWTAAGGTVKARGKTKTDGHTFVTMKLEQGDHVYHYEIMVPATGPSYTVYQVDTLKPEARPEWSARDLAKKLGSRGTTLSYSRIQFAPDGALLPASEPHIAAIATYLAKSPTVRLEMVVRTMEAKDKKLVVKRAKALTTWFAAHGVAAGAMTVTGVVVPKTDDPFESSPVVLRLRAEKPRSRAR